MDPHALYAAVFVSIKVGCGFVTCVLCVDRAQKMDANARRGARWVFSALAVAGGGLVLTPFMHGDTAKIFYGMYLLSGTALLLEGQKRWRRGMPDEMWDPLKTWPHVDRRSGEDRRRP
jgi:hypothetical protein